MQCKKNNLKEVISTLIYTALEKHQFAILATYCFYCFTADSTVSCEMQCSPLNFFFDCLSNPIQMWRKT